MKSDYQLVMTLGSWLERYLAPDLSSWDVPRLVDDALHILHIDHVRADDDLLVNSLISLLKDREKRVTITNNENSFSWFVELFKSANPYISKPVSLKQNKPFDEELLISDLFLSLLFPILITDIIQRLNSEPSAPWEHILLPNDTQPRVIPDKNLRLKYDNYNTLINSFNDIREVLATDLKERKIALVYKMNFRGSNTEEEWVRIPALLSRIFFSFLQGSGRDYCTLCKQCGQFVLAERKGRKQFCSGRCRIAHKRMKDKENA